MIRTEAIEIRTRQLQGEAVHPATLAAAIEIIKQRPPVNKGGRPPGAKDSKMRAKGRHEKTT